jgi:uncharacterized cupredoxin-like copper-binding protein
LEELDVLMKIRALSERLLAPLAVACVSLMLLALAGCGGSVLPNTVTVTLTEYKVQASQTTFTTGITYHFVVTNQGKQNHELMLIPPVSGNLGMGSNMDNLDKMALFVVGADKLASGATQHIDYTFTQPAAPGKLEFACHVGDHYQRGMRLSITVTSPAPASPTATR